MEKTITSTNKPHFPVLDGLRGMAALLVVAFHLMEVISPDRSALLLPHGYLAVDFFFILSGFVIGYAYDDSWPRLSAAAFLKARLIRLHPVIVAGVVLGTIFYFNDPFALVSHTPSHAAAITAFIAGLILLPSWPLPDRGTNYFPYNGVLWTLFLEYLASIAYALLLRRMTKPSLAALVALAAALLVWRAAVYDTIHLGYDWNTIDMAPVRLAFSFTAGLLLHRISRGAAAFSLGVAPLSLLLLTAFAMPIFSYDANIAWNGLYDAGIVILLFPAMIAAGAHPVKSKGWTTVCQHLGRISYPLYGIHFPAVHVYAGWIRVTEPSRGSAVAVGAAIWAGTLLVAWAVTLLWDEPIRRALRRDRKSRTPAYAAEGA